MKRNIKQDKYGWNVYYYYKGAKAHRHFKNLDDAELWNASCVVKEAEGTLDLRDYRRDNPLGFSNCANKYLDSKRLLKSVKDYRKSLNHAMRLWDNKNVKTIKHGDVQELITHLTEQGKATKTIHEVVQRVKGVYRWLLDNGDIKYDDMPKFPRVKYHSAFRKIIDKDTQFRILGELQSITKFNPRIYIAVSFLCTYINLRPSELIAIKERDIDLDQGKILIPHPKERRPKYVYLLEDDIDILRSEIKRVQGIGTYFFRHLSGRGAGVRGKRFGKQYLYLWWKKGCANLGIADVDLYGGTMHSSAVDARLRGRTPEEIKRAAMRSTWGAMDRYILATPEELRGMYAETRGEIVRFDENKNVSHNG